MALNPNAHLLRRGSKSKLSYKSYQMKITLSRGKKPIHKGYLNPKQQTTKRI